MLYLKHEKKNPVTTYQVLFKKKSGVFLYTNNKLLEKEMKKTIQFMTASKRIKHLGINLTKDVKGLYTENYKTLMTEIEDDTNK